MGRLAILLIVAAGSAGCWNSKDGVRADWGKGGGGVFDRGNAQARSKDRAANESLDPADDVFLRGSRTQVADAGKKKAKQRIEDFGSPDDVPVLAEASGTESERESVASGDGRRSGEQASFSSIEQTAEYKRIRQRLEAIKATWSSEKLAKTQGYSVRCEVPHPTDSELAQVFEAKSADELAALRAAVNQAEKWRTGVKRKFDPAEADLDPFAP